MESNILISLSKIKDKNIKLIIVGNGPLKKDLKELAKELNYIFIDSGAMYRGVTLFAIENELISDNKIEIQRLLIIT